MKRAGTVLLWVVGALLVLAAYDSFVVHPAGRWQLHTGPNGVWKMDTTTGEAWSYSGNGWVKLDGPTPK